MQCVLFWPGILGTFICCFHFFHVEAPNLQCSFFEWFLVYNQIHKDGSHSNKNYINRTDDSKRAGKLSNQTDISALWRSSQQQQPLSDKLMALEFTHYHPLQWHATHTMFKHTRLQVFTNNALCYNCPSVGGTL